MRRKTTPKKTKRAPLPALRRWPEDYLITKRPAPRGDAPAEVPTSPDRLRVTGREETASHE